MTDALWSALGHPAVIFGNDGGGTMVLLAGIVALVTTGFMAAIKRCAIARRYGVAVLLGSSFVPALLSGTAFVVANSHPDGTDGGGILVFAALLLSICAMPITLGTSMLYMGVSRKRTAGGRASVPTISSGTPPQG